MRLVSSQEYIKAVLETAEYKQCEKFDCVVAFVRALSGCITQGRNYEEARTLLADAVKARVFIAIRDGEELPEVNGCRLSVEERIEWCNKILQEKIEDVKTHLKDETGIYLPKHLEALERLRDHPELKKVWLHVPPGDVDYFLYTILDGLNYPGTTARQVVQEMTEYLDMLRKVARKAITTRLTINRAKLTGEKPQQVQAIINGKKVSLLVSIPGYSHREILSRLIKSVEDHIDGVKSAVGFGRTPLPVRNRNPERVYFVRSLVHYFWEREKRYRYGLVATIASIILGDPDITKVTVAKIAEPFVKGNREIEKSPPYQDIRKRYIPKE